MAEVAFVFHWPLSDLEELPLERLMAFRNAAIEQWNRVHAPKEG